MMPAKRALISVFDKRDVVEFATGLRNLGIEILSTGGTFRTLEEAGVEPIRVADVTGFPEILGGRVKTLHPKIHGGILADRDQASHVKDLGEHGITPIDLVVVNLYPFRRTAQTPGEPVEKIIEMIDIGGPTMVRAAAKNFQGVVVVVDPEDYPQVLAALEETCGASSLSRPFGIPKPTMRRSPSGSRSRATATTVSCHRDFCSICARSRPCATARILTNKPPSTGSREDQVSSALSSSIRARSCHSTTCSTSRPHAEPSPCSPSRR